FRPFQCEESAAATRGAPSNAGLPGHGSATPVPGNADFVNLWVTLEIRNYENVNAFRPAGNRAGGTMAPDRGSNAAGRTDGCGMSPLLLPASSLQRPLQGRPLT